MTPPARYRADIDGLRAVAILAVVAFHVGAPGAAWGFIGVDIFFVISGFLITDILLRESDRSGRIGLADFYARRVRRLIPALTAMILVVLMLGVLVLPPNGERQDLGEAAMAAAGFLANLHGLTAETGYFGRMAYTLPLLHTWTLAVEEQFYLVWPLVILLAIHLARRVKIPAQGVLGLCLVAGGLVSFALALWLSSHRPEAGFFLPFSRAWEFAAGAVLALGAVQRAMHRFKNACSLIGLALLLLTPGLYLAGLIAGANVYSAPVLVPPVLGAALLIASGGAGRRTVVNTVLAWRPLASLGKLSYSWYLWHWPLLSLTRMNALGEINLARDLCVALASLVLAGLSWRLIERPARTATKGPFSDRRRTLSWGGALLLICLAAGLAVKIQAERALTHEVGPVADRWRATAAAQVLKLDLPHACDNLGGVANIAPASLCLTGDRNADKTIVLWGDSHARQYIPPMAEAARRERFTLLPRAQSSCRVTGEASDYPEACAAANATVVGEIADLAKRGRLGGVVIAGIWTIEAKWRDDLEQVLADIGRQGGRVLLVMDNIRFPNDVLACYARRGSDGCDLDRLAVEKRRARVRAALESIAAAHPNVRVMDAADQVCSDTRCPVATPKGMLYFDHNHLTNMGADLYVDAFADQAAWLLQRQPGTSGR